LHFFALHLTTGLKIPGAVIPLNVFTRPGSKTEPPFDARMSALASYGHAAAWALAGYVQILLQKSKIAR
jgi:hypothetical protein